MSNDAPADPAAARALTPRPPSGTTGRPTRPAGIGHGPDGEILVVGPVDLSTSRALRTALEEAAAQGGEVLVDLREVQLLQSPGVAALFDAAEYGLRLRVRSGSAVASVIRICGLDRVAAVEQHP
ncbi:MAG TPA: STAS domain-containing protein [Sporichthyaceae bacterium]|nr:STAS domain-containing protein [Sporichthyaceae bacterium]